MATTKQVIEQMKDEIREEVHNKKIPQSVKSFAELHDYIDANELGGFCDSMSPYWPSTKFLNECQNAVDKWIKSGGLLTN